MSNLLVTGAAGFIGSNFVHYWHKRSPQDTIVVLDALTYAGCKLSLDSYEGTDWYIFVKGSVCDQALVDFLLRKHRINIIVNFAAESHVDRSISTPDEFIDTNIVGTTFC